MKPQRNRSQKPAPSEDQPEPVNVTGPHPMDALLRQHGYAIQARPKAGEAIWTRSGQEYGQREALASIPLRERLDVGYEHDLA